MTAGRMGKPPIFETPEILENHIEEYFKACIRVNDDGSETQTRPITLEGLAYHIGCDRKSIWNYKQKPEFYPLVKKAIDRCNVSLIEHALTARNPAGAIWLACNNHEYTQKSELTVTAQPEQLSANDVKELLKKK